MDIPGPLSNNSSGEEKVTHRPDLVERRRIEQEQGKGPQENSERSLIKYAPLPSHLKTDMMSQEHETGQSKPPQIRDDRFALLRPDQRYINSIPITERSILLQKLDLYSRFSTKQDRSVQTDPIPIEWLEHALETAQALIYREAEEVGDRADNIRRAEVYSFVPENLRKRFESTLCEFQTLQEDYKQGRKKASDLKRLTEVLSSWNEKVGEIVGPEQDAYDLIGMRLEDFSNIKLITHKMKNKMQKGSLILPGHLAGKVL